MRKRIKRASLAVAKASGLLDAIENSRWRSERLAIVGYHGISLEDEHEWDPTLYMSPAVFERRMELLKRKRFRVLPLEEAVERLYRRDLPPKAAVLTFDDGTHDFYARAWPILRRYGYPATVFLTTYYCDYNRPVFDTMASYLLWKGRGAELDAQPLGIDRKFDLRGRAGRQAAWSVLCALAVERELDGAGKNHLLEQLAELVGANYGELARRRLLGLLSPAEVSELAGHGIEFELHTHRHRTPLDRGLFLKEIRDNRDRIRFLAGSGAGTHFCYPSGSYKREFLPWLAENSVRIAVTCDPGLAQATADPLLLPRVLDHSRLSEAEFESCLSGLAYFVPGAAAPLRVPVDDLERLHGVAAAG